MMLLYIKLFSNSDVLLILCESLIILLLPTLFLELLIFVELSVIKISDLGLYDEFSEILFSNLKFSNILVLDIPNESFC